MEKEINYEELSAQLRCPNGEKAIETAENMFQSNSRMIFKTIDSLTLEPEAHILEIGFGNGKHLDYLFDRESDIMYYGVDISLFTEVYADKVDPNIAIFMLQGSTERLMFGALIAAMTASLFLPGIWLAFQYLKDKTQWYVYVTYFILILSVMLRPLGHAVFFFTGEIYKAIYHTDVRAHPYLLQTASVFMKVFYITWAPAIIILFIGWLLYSLLVFTKKTLLPRWAGFISPVFLTLYQPPLKLLMPSSEVKSWINAADLIFLI